MPAPRAAMERMGQAGTYSMIDAILPDIAVEKPASSLQAPSKEFQEALLAGLARTDKAIPCRFLYDEAGSALFDLICTLPEYYPTRTEIAILRDNADDMAQRICPQARVIELGVGSGGKVEWLLDALLRPSSYICIDISPVPLAANAERVARRYPVQPRQHHGVTPICFDPIPRPRLS